MLRFASARLFSCLSVFAALGVASAAQAGCQEDLAAVDAAMAYVELDGEPLNYLLARRAQAGELCAAGDEAGATPLVNELAFMTGLISTPIVEEGVQ